MPSLDDNFNEVLERMQQGRKFDFANHEPIYYLIFRPSEILEAKRSLPIWIARLKKQGYSVTVFSMAEAIATLLTECPFRKLWLETEQVDPAAWGMTTETLASYLSEGQLRDQLATTLAEVEQDPHGFLLITDLEALHPYVRIGALENQLQGQFSRPTVILYPGERTGTTRLRFLGFYPDDANYRSVHVG